MPQASAVKLTSHKSGNKNVQSLHRQDLGSSQNVASVSCYSLSQLPYSCS